MTTRERIASEYEEVLFLEGPVFIDTRVAE